MKESYIGNHFPNSTQLCLLRAAFSSDISAQRAWEKWTSLIDFDLVDPASYKLLPLVSRNPALRHIKDPLFEKCKGIYRKTWLTNHLMWQKTRPILLQLAQERTEQVVLLKGMAMILEYYRDFGLRVIGDIDILIAQKDLSHTIELLQQHGLKALFLPINPTQPLSLNRWNSAGFSSQDLHIDVHWRLMLESSPLLDDIVFKNTRPTTHQGITVPSPTELLLHTCVHGAKYSPVPLIRWIPDAMTLLKEHIDWERLELLAKSSHVCNALHITLGYLEEVFQAPIPSQILKNLQKSPSYSLQHLEYQSNLRGQPYLAGWYRYCIRNQCLTTWQQSKGIIRYLQASALLASPWLVPVYGVYWIMKRIYRKSRLFIKSILPKNIF